MPKSATATPAAEGTVDWTGAEAYMQGKSGDDSTTGDKTETPEFVEFKHRGKVLKVDRDTAATLEELRRDARGANGRLGSELARTRERLARLEGEITAGRRTPETEPAIPPLPDPLLATRDITAWQRQYDAHHSAKMDHMRADLEGRYNADRQAEAERARTGQREQEWANRFYSEYDHLDDPDLKPIVAQVYTEHKAEIDAFGDDLSAAHEHLAELADARLVRLKKAGRGDTTNNDRRPPRVESSAGPTPGMQTEDKPREFSAASWVAKERLKMSGREPKK